MRINSGLKPINNFLSEITHPFCTRDHFCELQKNSLTKRVSKFSPKFIYEMVFKEITHYLI
jgi:hypothetical protein